ncbi:hypothetical protein IWX65_003602 [Arthrobacter sp. CAN_A214]|uniref:hypothetical protein n=1 Tax=Arthrobacter sp. CAN_A214 TaxID=2787720 RepID=UPI0018C9475B
MTTSPAVMVIGVPTAEASTADASAVEGPVVEGPVDVPVEAAGSVAAVSLAAVVEHAARVMTAVGARAMRDRGFFMES